MHRIDDGGAAKELALIREAACDPSLSDAAVRAVAAGLDEPTAKDIEWAAGELRRVPMVPLPAEDMCVDPQEDR
jgi:hypothetical protein